MTSSIGYDFSINPNFQTEVSYIGHTQEPVLVVDNLVNKPEDLVSYAQTGPEFQHRKQDFYPGLRQPGPNTYSDQLCQNMVDLIHRVFGCEEGLKPASCVLSLATTAPEKLRPIQSVPHFDSCDATTLAVVHYLCPREHGGTSFYRHRQTGYESMTLPRLQGYAATLKQQMMAAPSMMHQYINGDTALFEQVACFEARFNRALFYRCNILHSGNIQPQLGLSSDPSRGRLTINTLISTGTH